MSTSILTKHQTKTYGPRQYREGGQTLQITATVRYDDQCGNGHNTFSITANIRRKAGNGRWVDYGGGCCHDEVAKRFPELRPLIKWHLVSSNGPMHYPGNVLYHAGDKDHNGLRKGESRQIRNGRTGKLVWQLDGVPGSMDRLIDADVCPDPLTLQYVPALTVGEGKAREFDHARSCAVWPEATDAELMADDLADKLAARLPALMVEFQAAVESLGFTF